MTQQPLHLEPESATDRLARLFAQAGPGRWFDIPQLAAVAGLGAWRTEISRCRQQYGMRFSNRITRDARNKVVTSEYRLVDRGWWPERRPSRRQPAGEAA